MAKTDRDLRKASIPWVASHRQYVVLYDSGHFGTIRYFTQREGAIGEAAKATLSYQQLRLTTVCDDYHRYPVDTNVDLPIILIYLVLPCPCGHQAGSFSFRPTT